MPEAQGGRNDEDNAIVLCFDCHADAGHYNPKHPRGTKFSPSELKHHRENWHSTVRVQAVEPPVEPDSLICRYLLCKSFEAFREVTLGELSNVPAHQPLLVTNEVRGFHRGLVDRHREPFRHEQVWGEAFDTHDSFTQVHPEVQIVQRSSINLYPYFRAVRLPAAEELRERVAPQDVVTRLLLEAEVPLREISLALAYDEVCGQGQFQEIYRLRPLWGLYLAATNSTESHLRLEVLVCNTEAPEGLGYRPFVHTAGIVKTEQPLPAALVPPQSTILIPLATLLGPIGNVDYQTMSEESGYLPGGQGQLVSHQDMTAAYETSALIGPALWPISIRVTQAAVTREQALHQFDLSNLYTISRFWEAGSCPHLFAVESERTTRKYLRELFARTPGKRATESILVERGIRALIIAELEPERTILNEVRVNGRLSLKGLTLNQGQSLQVEVCSGDLVQITGQYDSLPGARPEPWERNRRVNEFILRAA